MSTRIEAKVKCPNCSHKFTVRQKDKTVPSAENRKKIFNEADKLFDQVGEAFRSIFDPKKWK